MATQLEMNYEEKPFLNFVSIFKKNKFVFDGIIKLPYFSLL